MRLHPRSTFLASAGAGLASVALPRVAEAQSTTVRVAGGATDVYSGPFYASAAGTFAKYGLDIQPSLYNVAAATAAIGAGSLEMSVGDLISGVSAIVAGVPVVILAGGGLYRTPADRAGNILAAATASPIQSAKDFAGKTIGLPTLVGLTTACLRAWLPAHGVPLSSVRLTELPPASMVPALQRGTIDVALLSEPFVTLGKGDVRAVGYPFDEAANRSKNHEFCFSVWYASKAWVEQDHDRARRAVQAIYDGARWANSHRDETLDILIKNRKLDADKIQGMARVTFATSLTPDLINPVLEVANEQSVFSKQVTAESLIAKL
jgi:ABC-type nitrate/sulfonate/bicarbonate transport system substrate-binding protein